MDQIAWWVAHLPHILIGLVEIPYEWVKDNYWTPRCYHDCPGPGTKPSLKNQRIKLANIQRESLEGKQWKL